MAYSHIVPTPVGPNHPAWRRAYDQVLLERDPLVLFKRMEVAESAVRLRREALAQSGGHPEEQRLLEEALRKLRDLKRERLNFHADDSYGDNLSCEDFSSDNF